MTPADQAKFGLSWSLKLTSEGGFIVALLVGLAIANFFPAFAVWLKSAIRPKLYIKIAIVILGAFIAVTAAGKLNLASSLLLRGIAAIVDLLAGRLFDRTQGVWLQPRVVSPARLGHLDLRRRGGDRDRRGHSRAPTSACARVVAGGDFRGDRSPDPAGDRSSFHVARAAGRATFLIALALSLGAHGAAPAKLAAAIGEANVFRVIF